MSAVVWCLQWLAILAPFSHFLVGAYKASAFAQGHITRDLSRNIALVLMFSLLPQSFEDASRALTSANPLGVGGNPGYYDQSGLAAYKKQSFCSLHRSQNRGPQEATHSAHRACYQVQVQTAMWLDLSFSPKRLR